MVPPSPEHALAARGLSGQRKSHTYAGAGNVVVVVASVRPWSWTKSSPFSAHVFGSKRAPRPEQNNKSRRHRRHTASHAASLHSTRHIWRGPPYHQSTLMAPPCVFLWPLSLPSRHVIVVSRPGLVEDRSSGGRISKRLGHPPFTHRAQNCSWLRALAAKTAHDAGQLPIHPSQHANAAADASLVLINSP